MIADYNITDIIFTITKRTSLPTQELLEDLSVIIPEAVVTGISYSRGERLSFYPTMRGVILKAFPEITAQQFSLQFLVPNNKRRKFLKFIENLTDRVDSRVSGYLTLYYRQKANTSGTIDTHLADISVAFKSRTSTVQGSSELFTVGVVGSLMEVFPWQAAYETR